MPIANFTTYGSTTTHSALSKTLCGILSGAFRISCITVPAFSTRSCSFFWAALGNARTEASPRHTHILFMTPPFNCLNCGTRSEKHNYRAFPPYLSNRQQAKPNKFLPTGSHRNARITETLTLSDLQLRD